jgi:hypothetical protein
MVRRALLVAIGALALGSGSAGAQSGAYNFTMPSRNIFCAYEHYSFAPIDLRCEIRSGVKPLPPRPAACNADWGAGYTMRRTGFARVLCISDTIYTPSAKLFPYGTRLVLGSFTCDSATAGLKCRNASGHGFFLSRERSYTF